MIAGVGSGWGASRDGNRRRLDSRGRLSLRRFDLLITYTNCFLKKIGHILARYTAWVLGLMKVLGIWGPFVIAFADSALLGMPVDFIVATYVWQDRKRMLLYVAMASLGSALGSIPLYIVGYLGGEKVLRKRISEERFLKIHASFERHEFWALMFPGMLPPPTPFKIFVLGAAVFEMRFRDFLVAIFAGRFVRFLVLSVLVLYFGPQIVGLFGGVVKRHWILVAAVIVGGICCVAGMAALAAGASGIGRGRRVGCRRCNFRDGRRVQSG